MNLRSKKVLLAAWGCENPQDTHMHQIWYLTLKKIFPKIQTFDTKKIYFQSGKEEMNKQFLANVRNNKPEIILFTIDNEEFSLSTLERLLKILPKTKKIALTFIGSTDCTYKVHDNGTLTRIPILEIPANLIENGISKKEAQALIKQHEVERGQKIQLIHDALYLIKSLINE